MKVSYSIMAHPSRKNFIPYLLKNVPNAKVFYDLGFGLKQNAINCWKSYDKTAKYHLVIQDDAILCEDFTNKIIPYLEQNKEVISFFMSKRVKSEELKETEYFFEREWLTGAVCLAVRTDHIEKIIKSLKQSKIQNDDTIIGKYCKNHKLKVYYSKPNLVDHRTGIMSIVEKNIVPKQRSAYENISIQE